MFWWYSFMRVWNEVVRQLSNWQQFLNVNTVINICIHNLKTTHKMQAHVNCIIFAYVCQYDLHIHKILPGLSCCDTFLVESQYYPAVEAADRLFVAWRVQSHPPTRVLQDRIYTNDIHCQSQKCEKLVNGIFQNPNFTKFTCNDWKKGFLLSPIISNFPVSGHWNFGCVKEKDISALWN